MHRNTQQIYLIPKQHANFGVHDATLASGKKAIAETMEIPRGKLLSGPNTMVKTMHSKWRCELRNGVFMYILLKTSLSVVRIQIYFSSHVTSTLML